VTSPTDPPAPPDAAADEPPKRPGTSTFTIEGRAAPGGPRRQLADLELRHRRRARVEDRIRAAKDTGLRNLPCEDFVRNDVFAARGALRGIPVRLDCGRDDRFIEANRAFARELPDAAVTFDEGALTAIATKALKRGTGARGLRAILEEVLMDVMFDLPSREDVVEVKVTESCITNGTQPLLEISPVRRKKEA